MSDRGVGGLSSSEHLNALLVQGTYWKVIEVPVDCSDFV